VLGSRLKVGCADRGIAGGLVEMVGQYAGGQNADD